MFPKPRVRALRQGSSVGQSTNSHLKIPATI